MLIVNQYKVIPIKDKLIKGQILIDLLGFSLAEFRIIAYICSEEKKKGFRYNNVTDDTRSNSNRTWNGFNEPRENEPEEDQEVEEELLCQTRRNWRSRTFPQIDVFF